MRRWTRSLPAEPDRAILSNVWTTSTCYKPLEIERPELSRQLLQERLRLLQVSSIKALREPAIDRCQEGSGFGALALLLPQPPQAQRRPQLPRLGLLAAGQGQGLVKAGLSMGYIRDGLAQEEFALEPMRFRH